MPCHRPLGSVEIRLALPADFPVIRDLARRIWPAAFSAIISRAQIDYMLEQRYTDAALHEATRSGQLHYELLSVDGEPVAWTAHGPADAPGAYKLHQLYVLPDWQSQGLGGRLIDHVAAVARGLGRSELVLTVNRRNERAQAAYLRRGFVITGSACFDIGHGHVMDDFLLSLPLVHPGPPGVNPGI